MPGRRSFSAAATPEIRPPPPTPTTTTSRSGRSSSSSRPIEPWPAMTAGSSNGWTNSRPSTSRSRSISAKVSPTCDAVEDDPGAVAEARLDLRADGASRHDHRHRDAGRAAGPRVGLPGVAGRQRDHAARLGLVGQRRDLVGHAARLERAGLLEVLRLEVEPVVAEPRAGGDRRPGRGRRRAEQRRAVDAAGDALARGDDLVDR